MAMTGGAATPIDDASPDLVSLARNGVWVGLGLAVAGFFTFALSVVIARALGAFETGVFYAAVSVFTVMTTVAQLGADFGLLRFLPRHRVQGRFSDIRSDLVVALIPVAVAGAVCAVCLVGIAHWLGEQSRPGEIERCLILLAPMAIPVALAGPVIAATRGLGTPKPFVLIECVSKPGARLACMALVVGALSAGTATAILTWGAVAIGASVAGGFALRKLVRELPPAEVAPSDRKDLAREFWRFTAPRAVGSALSITLLWLDLVLLGVLRGPTDAGIYSAVIRYGSLVTLALGAVILVVAPQISGYFAKGQIGRVGDVYRVSTVWLSMLSLPIIVVTAVFSPALMSVYGPEFARGAPALTILALAMLFNILAGPCNVVLLMGGSSALNLMNLCVAVILNVALNLALIPRYGTVGAAIAWAVAIAVTNTLPIVQIHRRWKLHPGSAALVAVSALVLATFGVVSVGIRLAYGATFRNMVIAIVVATVAYLIGLWRIRRLAKLDVAGVAVGQMRGRAHRSQTGAG